MRGIKNTIIAVALIAALLASIYYMQHVNIAVLNPQGIVAQKQRELIVFTTLLGLLIVVPVFALTFGIAWKYREGNKRAKYSPDWDRNIFAESVWWGIPTLLIIVVSVVTWNSSHSLDPSRQLVSDTQPINVQVIALQSKWLFIYPDQQIASVNYLQFPQKTPINFYITSDAAMNSFWIPQLGGQIYAMAGMSTQLHLMADHTGSYRGSSANLSGPEFAGMNFIAQATSDGDFKRWVQNTKQSAARLNMDEYAIVNKPKPANKVANYNLADQKLYDKIIMKYTEPWQDMHGVKTYKVDHNAH